MRGWGSVGLMAVSVLVAPIAVAAPAHAAGACIPIYRRCPPTTSPPVTSPPVTSPPVTAPPVTAPPVQTPVPPPTSIDPDVAAAQFFDATNAARASSGLPALAWRSDVAGMAVGHSVEMAQAGSIWHGSFVSSPNLKGLNASSLGENVGMGQAVGQLHDAFMNSPHHRENILDGGFNQVGIGVIVVQGEMFVTEDFLQAKGGPATARPTPVAHPVVTAPAKPKSTTSKVAAAPKKTTPSTNVAPPSTAGPSSTSTAPPTTSTTGEVTALNSEPVTAAPAKIAPQPVSNHDGTVVAAMFGALLLFGAAAGHVVVRRRRPTA